MNLLKDWLGITALENRQAVTEDFLKMTVVQVNDMRDTLDKLSELVLAYQGKTWLKTEIPVEKPKKSVTKKKKE
ncbi:MAG: hypothetical protein A3F13_02775 [Gammaproteobacteria bacterium RIFCSPHIGHO2_12_FULL_40_19]|nr:MAG: hypothetical protein A3F13_02775 [Gammaproteobacteria bacterium RIFCSPHIGHO2_12_FULL_40_19]